MGEPRAASQAESPPAALWAIALLALAPFPVAAGVYGYGPAATMGEALEALLTLAAITISFLAGVRWGLETREPEPRWGRQAFSAGAALAAWILLLARAHAQPPWLIGAFLFLLLIEWLFDHQTPNTPSRYPLLSTAVTAAASVSLAVALERALNG